MSNLDQFVSRAETAEKEVEKLVAELENMKTALASGSGGVQQEEDVPEELKKLRQENSRLKYRLNILKRAVEEETTNTDCLTNIAQSLITFFSQAVTATFPPLQDFPCPIVPSSKGGDYQFNGAMAISGLLKSKGVKAIPRDVAAKIVENVPSNDLIERN